MEILLSVILVGSNVVLFWMWRRALDEVELRNVGLGLYELEVRELKRKLKEGGGR